jgi:hypothetical protein
VGIGSSRGVGVNLSGEPLPCIALSNWNHVFLEKSYSEPIVVFFMAHVPTVFREIMSELGIKEVRHTFADKKQACLLVSDFNQILNKIVNAPDPMSSFGVPVNRIGRLIALELVISSLREKNWEASPAQSIEQLEKYAAVDCGLEEMTAFIKNGAVAEEITDFRRIPSVLLEKLLS